MEDHFMESSMTEKMLKSSKEEEEEEQDQIEYDGPPAEQDAIELQDTDCNNKGGHPGSNGHRRWKGFQFAG